MPTLKMIFLLELISNDKETTYCFNPMGMDVDSDSNYHNHLKYNPLI